jgi:uncharacterized membrane protein YecN with MAPEG domain
VGAAHSVAAPTPLSSPLLHRCIPLALLQIALLESSSRVPGLALHGLGAALVASRGAHAAALAGTMSRVPGVVGTTAVIATASLALLAQGLGLA